MTSEQTSLDGFIEAAEPSSTQKKLTEKPSQSSNSHATSTIISGLHQLAPTLEELHQARNEYFNATAKNAEERKREVLAKQLALLVKVRLQASTPEQKQQLEELQGNTTSDVNELLESGELDDVLEAMDFEEMAEMFSEDDVLAELTEAGFSQADIAEVRDLKEDTDTETNSSTSQISDDGSMFLLYLLFASYTLDTYIERNDVEVRAAKRGIWILTIAIQMKTIT